MTDRLVHRVPAPAAGWVAYVLAALLVALATAAGLIIAPAWGNASVVLLYILPVLGAATWYGLAPGLLAGLLSALAYNYFFTAPYRTLLIYSPADVMTVVILFLVALVTSQLAGSMRAQAGLAAAAATRNATIAGFARQLLSSRDEQEICRISVGELSRLFDCQSLVLTRPETAGVSASEPAGIQLEPSDFAAAALTLDSAIVSGRHADRVEPADWQFHPVSGSSAVLAAVGLARKDGAPPVLADQALLLSNLLDQMALAIERARLDHEARHLTALKERDRLRSNLLATIGSDVKPRLVSISTAAKALRREGKADRQEIARIADEAARLDRYLENLVQTDLSADQHPLELGPISVDFYNRRVTRDGQDVHLTPKEYALVAELARHAGRVLPHSHLLRSIWGPAQEDHIDYLRVAIRSLRQKLEADPSRPSLIVNEPAVGYRLAVPVSAAG